MRVTSIVVLMALVGCSQNELAPGRDSDLTGKEITYSLTSGGVYQISGTAVFNERKDGSTKISIALTGVEDGNGLQFPVHLHYGDVSTDKAAIAKLLNYVNGSTGVSETILSKLEDGSGITFAQLKEMNGCLKIHLSDVGPGRDVILAAGNIGSAVGDSSGRLSIGMCKSE